MSGSTQDALYFSMMWTRSLRLGQLGVDRRGEGVHEFRPGRIVEPERGAAFPAEIALAGGNLATRTFVVLDLGPVEAEVALAGDLQRLRDRAEVDGVSAAALLLAADRAIAQHEGTGVWLSTSKRTAPQRQEPLRRSGKGILQRFTVTTFAKIRLQPSRDDMAVTAAIMPDGQ